MFALADTAVHNLPLFRWSDYTDVLRVRTDGGNFFTSIGGIFSSIPAWQTSGWLSISNGLWKATGNVALYADKAEPLQTVGQKVDELLSGVWNNLLSNYYLFGLIFIVTLLTGLMGVVFPSMQRGDGMAKRMVQYVVGVGMVTAMSAGAAASTADVPGFMSPWWVAQNVSAVVDTVGGQLNEFTGYETQITKGVRNHTGIDSLSCRRYILKLNDFAKVDMEDGKAMYSPMTRDLSNYWLDTSAYTWAQMQYGQDSKVEGVDNTRRVFCRALESRAGILAQTQYTISMGNAGALDPASDQRALIWSTSQWMASSEKEIDEDRMEDRRMMAFETCGVNPTTGKVQVKKGWWWINSLRGGDRGIEGYDADLLANCEAAINGVAPNGTSYLVPGGEGDKEEQRTNTVEGSGNYKRIANKFDIPHNNGWSTYVDSNNEGEMAAATTVRAMHGVANWSNVAIGMASTGAAASHFVVYGGLSLLKLLAKLAVGFLALCIPFAFLILSASSKGRESVKSAFKLTCNASMAGVAITFVSSVIMCISEILVRLLFQDFGIAQILMLMVSPFAAIALVKWMCKSVLKIGDPLSVKGFAEMTGSGALVDGAKKGLTFAAGAALGAVGGAVVGGGLAGAAQGAMRGAGSRNPMSALGQGTHAGQSAKRDRALERLAESRQAAQGRKRDRPEDDKPNEADDTTQTTSQETGTGTEADEKSGTPTTSSPTPDDTKTGDETGPRSPMDRYADRESDPSKDPAPLSSESASYGDIDSRERKEEDRADRAERYVGVEELDEARKITKEERRKVRREGGEVPSLKEMRHARKQLIGRKAGEKRYQQLLDAHNGGGSRRDRRKLKRLEEQGFKGKALQKKAQDMADKAGRRAVRRDAIGTGAAHAGRALTSKPVVRAAKVAGTALKIAAVPATLGASLVVPKLVGQGISRGMQRHDGQSLSIAERMHNAASRRAAMGNAGAYLSHLDVDNGKWAKRDNAQGEKS